MEESTETAQGSTEQPPKISFLTLVLRTLSGLGGGILGTFILIAFYLFAFSLFGTFFGDETSEFNPLHYFILIAMIFASSLGANLLSSFLLSLIKHTAKITTVLSQILIANIVILIICLPLYMFAFSIDFVSGSYIGGLQLGFSILASALILDIYSSGKHGLVWVYGTLFGTLLAIGLSIIMFLLTNSINVLLFMIFPLFWGGIAFIQTILMMLYRWLVSVFNSDFLALTKEYGKDYQRDIVKEIEEEEKEEEEKPEDKAGGDFLDNSGE